MEEKFQFSLTEEEKSYLKDLVRQSIQAGLQGKDASPPDPVSGKMKEHLGAFVTLKIKGHLRGCIGHITGDNPIYQTVWQMAQAAAFEDPRFPPLTEAEFESMDTEISILSKFTKVADTETIEPGRHGLYLRKGFHTGLLLPQVATEWGWDRETFLAHTCKKAGLPGNCWQKKNVEIFSFEAEIF